MDIPLHPSIQMAIGLLPIVWLLVAVVVRPQAGGRRREAAWPYCPVAGGDRGPGLGTEIERKRPAHQRREAFELVASSRFH